MRFWNNDALANVEGVLLRVEEALKLSGRFIDDGITPHPSPLPMGEGAMATVTAVPLLLIGEGVTEPSQACPRPAGKEFVAALPAVSPLPAGEEFVATFAAAFPLPWGEGQGEGRRA